MHLCLRQHNLTRLACCQLILLINESHRVPFCDFENSPAETNASSFSTVGVSALPRNTQQCSRGSHNIRVRNCDVVFDSSMLYDARLAFFETSV
uniref:Secreted protein n=1 Tax=Ascaris lumbricoides TaxID=6252 RepID=A0A9J2P440_ASCLU